MTVPTKKTEAPVGVMALKSFFGGDVIKDKFKEVLGKRSTAFITTTLQLCGNNNLLAEATPISVYGAVMTAATLDLPINPNLGFAYILPYSQKNKNTNKYEKVAQFQLGYKGFIQLAQRSGQIKTLSATPIYEGQIVSSNPLTGYVFDFETKTSDKVIGYAAYFSLLNGFEKTFYMSVEEITAHAKKYSQTFKNGYGIWKDNFEAMALKTVIKLMLSKFAPLSVDMQTAMEMDQAIINSEGEPEYADNEEDFQEAVEIQKKELRTKNPKKDNLP